MQHGVRGSGFGVWRLGLGIGVLKFGIGVLIACSDLCNSSRDVGVRQNQRRIFGFEPETYTQAVGVRMCGLHLFCGVCGTDK